MVEIKIGDYIEFECWICGEKGSAFIDGPYNSSDETYKVKDATKMKCCSIGEQENPKGRIQVGIEEITYPTVVSYMKKRKNEGN